MSGKEHSGENSNQGPLRPANRNLMQMMDDFFAKEPYRGILDSIDSFFQGSPFNYTFPVDFYETNNEWVVRADIPGVKRENIHLEVLGDRLKIGVMDDQSREEKNDQEQYFWRERRIHRAERTVQLPYKVSKRNTKASYRHGVLEVRGPKLNKQNIIDVQ